MHCAHKHSHVRQIVHSGYMYWMKYKIYLLYFSLVWGGARKGVVARVRMNGRMEIYACSQSVTGK